MKYILFFSLTFIVKALYAQDATLSGNIVSGGKPVPFASVFIDKTTLGTSTNDDGNYYLNNLPIGEIIVKVQAIGYISAFKKIDVQPREKIELNFELREDVMGLEEIVISGTRTDKRRIDSPVPVNILDAEIFSWSQSNTLVEGLNFVAGVRTEVDCQTCNYSQIRVNGLGGAYSQILINNRPIFSSLQGLYGLEQIPSAMVDRIEIIRGGGSALYGSSAIAGVVNILTKFPTSNTHEIAINHAIIDGKTHDSFVNAHLSTVNSSGKSGAVIFASKRTRQHYDANEDGYTEMPGLNNNTIGLNYFYKFNESAQLEWNLSNIHEERRGGNKMKSPAHLADQSEERIHRIWTGGINFKYKLPNKKSGLSVYFAGQHTVRDHYTGILPDVEEDLDSTALINHLADPPYGATLNRSLQGGIQWNQQIPNLIFGKNTISTGIEYQQDYIHDEITPYQYLVDQESRQLGYFLQNDWELTYNLTLLSGVRITRHNHVDQWMISPRASILYKMNSGMQWRASYSTGFRAPEAFDADLHMAFANGGVSRIQISPDLKEELSYSFSGSVDYNKSTLNYIYGFTLDGFYTHLSRAFILEELMVENGHQILEKRNGGLSTVRGISLELRGNYNALVQLESGITYQKSTHGEPVAWSSDLEGTTRFLKTPDLYGFYMLSFMPPKGLNVSLSGVYTGSMLVPHFGGAEGIDGDHVVHSPNFFDHNLKFEYPVYWKEMGQVVRLFAGVRNMFNQYQQDFDRGKNRDSNYVYGPASPRSVFFGIKIGSE